MCSTVWKIVIIKPDALHNNQINHISRQLETKPRINTEMDREPSIL